MRAAREQAISEELAQRVFDLTARVAELTRRLDLIEVVRGNGHAITHSIAATGENVEHGAEDSSKAIEFLTANDFVIVRPWEAGTSPAPAGGICHFIVSDPRGHEQKISVTISKELMTRTAIHTRGRIAWSSAFWICCAERHLANYVTEHDGFPEGSEIAVNDLDREEVLLAIRWGKSD